MRTKKRIFAFCGLICALLLSVSLSIGVMFAGTNPELSLSATYEESYDLGADFDIPQGTITIGENSATAETIIVFPNGAAYQTTATQLSQEGKYTVQYRATIAGKLYVKEVSFIVQSKLYSHSSGTKVEYGTYVAAEHNPKNFQPTGGEVTGLKVGLAGGDVFRYNKVIDLNTLTKENQIIQFAITPDEIGTADTMMMTMYLTDAYDPENFITIRVRQPEPVLGYSSLYMSAAAPGQTLTGWMWYRNQKHTGGSYGTAFYANFAGVFRESNGSVPHWKISTIEESTVQFSMDYATRELHCNVRNADSANSLVCDFDNPRDFADLWGGFTTGEVYLSLTSSSAANFVITEIAGRDVSDMEFGERTKPAVSLASDEYTESTIPSAVVGKPYPLFEATARSPYAGTLPVNTRVFANYYDENRYEVLVKDGVFTPTALGNYYIVYEARDHFGQIGSKVIPLTTVENPAEMLITRGDTVSTGIAGHPISVADPVVTQNIGNANVVATYTVDGSAPIQIEEGTFRPTKAGTYTITLTATDYVSREKSLSYDVVVEAGTKPVFENKPNLPIAFISDCEYELPSIYAYNYTDGSGAPVPVTISAVSPASETIVRGGIYTPSATTNGEIVTIKYTAMLSSGGVEEYAVDIPIIVPKDENGDLHLERFLVKTGEGVTGIEPLDSYTTVSFADSVSSVTWATPVLASGLNVEFSSADLRNCYDGVSITLTDSENPEQKIVVTYERSEKGATVYLNGERSDKYNAAQFFTDAEDKFLLSYVADSMAIKFDPYSSEKMSVEKMANGKPFTGFDSGKVYVTFQMVGVTRPTKMNVVSVSAQTVNNAYTERLGPRIAMSASYGGTFNLGMQITLAKAIVADAIDPSAKCFLTVKNPDGSYAITDDGVMLKTVKGEAEYVFTLTQNGKYRITYESTDMNGNEALKFSYVINVSDMEKPTITVHNKVATTAKVGQAIAIPKFSVEDNLTKAEDITKGVMFFTSEGNPHMIDLEKNDGFVPIRAGKHVLRYFACDEEGNYTILDYVIMVTE